MGKNNSETQTRPNTLGDELPHKIVELERLRAEKRDWNRVIDAKINALDSDIIQSAFNADQTLLPLN